MKNRTIVGLLSALVLAAGASSALAQMGTSFTYQGSLSVGNAAFTGNADLRFRLYDSPTGGTQIGAETPVNGVQVSRGLLTAEVDFGPVFSNRTVYLEIDAKPGAAASFTTLTPRQKITPSPASLFSAGPWAQFDSDLFYTGRVFVTSSSQTPNGDAFTVANSINPGKQLLMGVNDDHSSAWIGSILQGCCWTPLALQPDEGRVGIGCWDPVAQLQVRGASPGAPSISGGTSDNQGAIYNTTGWSLTPSIEARAASTDSPPAVIFHHINNSTMGIVAQNSPRGLRVTGPNNEAPAGLYTDGAVGVGTTDTASFMLAVNGLAANATGSWSVFSDARLKHDIKPIGAGTLDRLLSLHGVEFEYNADAVRDRHVAAGPTVGFVAQDLEKVFPEWVSKDAAGYRYVTERGTTALVVEALRDLRTEKENEIVKLRAEKDAQIADLTARLQRLEARLAK